MPYTEDSAKRILLCYLLTLSLHLQLLKAPSNLALNTLREWASITSLGNLFQYLTTLIFKAITLRAITTCPCKKSLFSFLVGPLQVLEGCYKVSPEPSLLCTEQPQLSQPVLIGELLQPSDHLRGPPLDLLQQVHVLLMLGAPELNAVLQDTVGFLGCKHTLLAHVELLINQHPQMLLLRAALNPPFAQPVFVLGIAPAHVQDLALGLVELHELCMGPPLKPVKVPLDGIPSLQCVNRTTQLGVISKLAEGALNPTVHVTDKCVKQCLSEYRPGFIPEEAKVCSPEVQGSELAVRPPQCPKDLELNHFTVTAAKAALELHIPHQPLLVGENKVQHSTSPRWLLCHLEKEVIINTFQEPPRLLMPCCVVPPRDIRAELHALQLVIDIEGNTPSLSLLPVFPKEPVSFYSNTPVIGDIPPHLHDANKIIALQLSHLLQEVLHLGTTFAGRSAACPCPRRKV
ncbi:hypothetical protein QYF61_006616 [Mycteria americana]|uniref:Uncharacterized protein n=1 Tax=Mycteria americana TaxID=33587 RepID=A0AAN7RYT6_MYCAM|nr:hypothetical protein QYF61_006616 [Mycteria americana]